MGLGLLLMLKQRDRQEFLCKNKLAGSATSSFEEVHTTGKIFKWESSENFSASATELFIKDSVDLSFLETDSEDLEKRLFFH